MQSLLIIFTTKKSVGLDDVSERAQLGQGGLWRLDQRAARLEGAELQPAEWRRVARAFRVRYRLQQSEQLASLAVHTSRRGQSTGHQTRVHDKRVQKVSGRNTNVQRNLSAHVSRVERRRRVRAVVARQQDQRGRRRRSDVSFSGLQVPEDDSAQ